MDGIGFIGAPQNIGGLQGAELNKKPAPMKGNVTSVQINDSLETGYFNGPEIKDPRKAFMFTGSEIKGTQSGNTLKQEISIEPGKGDIKAFSIDEQYLTGLQGNYKGLELNGPSNNTGGIVTLGGIRLDNPNPKFLFQE